MKKILFALLCVVLMSSCTRDTVQIDDPFVSELSIDQLNVINNSEVTKDFIETKFLIRDLIIRKLAEGYSTENIFEVFADASVSYLKNKEWKTFVFGTVQNAENYFSNLEAKRKAYLNQFSIMPSSTSPSVIEDDLKALIANAEIMFSQFEAEGVNQDTNDDYKSRACGGALDINNYNNSLAACQVDSSDPNTLICGWSSWCIFCETGDSTQDTFCH